MSIERHQIAIEFTSATRQLGFVIGLKRNHIQQAIANDNLTGVLSSYLQVPRNLATCNVNNGDLVFR